MQSNLRHPSCGARLLALSLPELFLFLVMEDSNLKSPEATGGDSGNRSKNGAFLSSQLMHPQPLTPDDDDDDDLVSNSLDSPPSRSLLPAHSMAADESDPDGRIQTQSPGQGRSTRPRKSSQKKKQPAKKESRGCGKKGATSGAGGRGLGFGKVELDSLLDLLEEHLPIGQMEWERVSNKHDERYPSVERTVDSLRRKFASLYRKNLPTGDPDIPREVRRAKAIRQKIIERSDIGDDDNLDDDVDDAFADDENCDALHDPVDESAETGNNNVRVQPLRANEPQRNAPREKSHTGEITGTPRNSRSPTSYTP